MLPVAATEQHGPHLPLSVDTDLVNVVEQASLAHLGADLPVLFLPTQTVGLSPEHARFAGTLTLRADTVIRLWTEIGECVAASGVNKLVLFNAHGGQVGAMDLVARDLRARLGMLVYSVNWFSLPLMQPKPLMRLIQTFMSAQPCCLIQAKSSRAAILKTPAMA